MFKCIQDNKTMCRKNTAFSLLKWYVTLLLNIKNFGIEVSQKPEGN